MAIDSSIEKATSQHCVSTSPTGPTRIGWSTTCSVRSHPTNKINALEGDSLLSVLRQLMASQKKRPDSFLPSVILCEVRDGRRNSAMKADRCTQPAVDAPTDGAEAGPSSRVPRDPALCSGGTGPLPGEEALSGRHGFGRLSRWAAPVLRPAPSYRSG